MEVPPIARWFKKWKIPKMTKRGTPEVDLDPPKILPVELTAISIPKKPLAALSRRFGAGVWCQMGAGQWVNGLLG